MLLTAYNVDAISTACPGSSRSRASTSTCTFETTRRRTFTLYGDDEVLVVVRDGSGYAGSLPAAKLALVREYVAANVDDLLARWVTYGGG
jgi:hypothetical protein